VLPPENGGARVRDNRVTVTLTCGKCGRSGLAIYEVPGPPPFARKLLSVTGEFWVGTGIDPAIYCNSCHEKLRSDE
jgi:hypothetical protein